MIARLKKDPDNSGSVLGWGVYRMAPWDLKGVFETKEDARLQAESAGEGYVVAFGSHRVGTDDFVGGHPE
ncbi:hypothetical protein C1S65_16490 [Pseudomonas putida]|uniref:Uncharacterized protein n=1 Tax=Pseudomonas putida TaxID=303 RepID=A0AAD0LAQ4_PSEPU|nr:hypothetical protein C1S65_16490 [Pseudomonas putida]